MIAAPPQGRFSPYYTKAIEWRGLYVLGADTVPDLALLTAAETAFNMLRYRSDIVAALSIQNSRFAVTPNNDRAVTLPEFSIFANDPTLNWAVGLGGVIGRPISNSSTVEILNLPGDEYKTQNIFLHEAAHLIENVGFDATSRAMLSSAFASAASIAQWGSYPKSNEDEYFATIAEAFFGMDREDSVVGTINTRAELQQFDPAAFTLATRIFGNDGWTDGMWAGNDSDNLFTGSAAGDFMFGWLGNDTLTGMGGNDVLDGGPGKDQVRQAGKIAETNRSLQADGSWLLINQATSEADKLYNIERVVFDDGIIAFDFKGPAGPDTLAGVAYRIYQAAFDRTPDIGGLSFWTKWLDDGKTDPFNMAGRFIDSNEFRALYGSSTPANGDFLTKVYQNVLDRSPDQGGYDFWVSRLDNGTFKQAEVLARFSDSDENRANVAPMISNGIILNNDYFIY